MNDGDSAIGVCGMIVGVFLLLGMKPVDFTDSLFLDYLNPKQSLRKRLRQTHQEEKNQGFSRGTGGSTEHPRNDGQGNSVFNSYSQFYWHVLRWGIPLLFCWGIFSLLPEMGSGFFISTVLVCETDCQSL